MKIQHGAPCRILECDFQLTPQKILICMNFSGAVLHAFRFSSYLPLGKIHSVRHKGASCFSCGITASCVKFTIEESSILTNESKLVPMMDMYDVED